MKQQQIKIPYYSGNIYQTDCKGHISLEEFVSMHKKPRIKDLKAFEMIYLATKQNLKEVKNRYKKRLLTFTPSVFIKKGDRRVYENIVEFTGLIQLDFDDIGANSDQDAEALREHIFHYHPEIICAYLSPSWRGVKAILKTKKPKDLQHYKAIYKAVEEDFSHYPGFDSATKNAILPLFASLDTHLLVRWDALDYEKENWEQEKYVNLNEKPTSTNFSGGYFNRITREIFEKKLQNIVDNGHPQLRNACLVLGSRCSAGYIKKHEAIDFAESLVKSHPYFKKDLKCYLRTVNWAIDQGMLNPKYY